jgi:hypothetical protein
MSKKFIPKIPPRQSESCTDAGSSLPGISIEGPQLDNQSSEGNVFVIRVKRRRDEESRQTLIVGRDDSEREPKKVYNPSLEMSRLSIGNQVSGGAAKHPTETKVFKLIGTVPITTPIQFTGNTEKQGNVTETVSDSSVPENQESRNILRKISEHCKLQERDRNVKRENAPQRADIKSRIRYLLDAYHALLSTLIRVYAIGKLLPFRRLQEPRIFVERG